MHVCACMHVHAWAPPPTFHIFSNHAHPRPRGPKSLKNTNQDNSILSEHFVISKHSYTHKD